MEILRLILISCVAYQSSKAFSIKKESSDSENDTKYNLPIVPGEECTEYEGSCYLFSLKPKTLNSARHFCERLEGAHLVIIETKEEYDWVTKTIKKTVEDAGSYLGELWGTGKEQWWTAGKRDKEDHDKWVWQLPDDETKPLDESYQEWDHGEPNDQLGTEDYIVLANSWGGWGYNDMAKCNELRFVCEIKLY